MRLSEDDLQSVAGGRVDSAVGQYASDGADRYAAYREKAKKSRWKNMNQGWRCKTEGCEGELHHIITQGFVCDVCGKCFRSPN